MSRLLINGCSYTINWKLNCGQLGQKLGFDQTVNIGKSGSSNQRIFRTTLDYILTHGADFVILSLTFWDRQEAPWGKTGEWVDYSANGIMINSEPLRYSRSFYSDYIKNRYMYDMGSAYIDKFLNDIILFSGWLDQLGVRYLMFIAPYENINFDSAKLNYINKNNRIIDIKNWSSNQYIYEHGGISNEKGINIEPSYLHYDAESYTILNDFLFDYIIKHKL